LNIIQGLAKKQSDITILFITGTPATHLFEFLPKNSDVIKIPTIVTSTVSEGRPPTLDLSTPELSLLRSRLIEEAVTQFEPDVFVVDNFPLGSRRELLPLLKRLRRESTETVLGLRDIVDPPEKIKKDWMRDEMYEIIDRYYKRILVYGMQEVFDVVTEYGLEDKIASKVHYCGYVTSNNVQSETKKIDIEELNIERPYVIATVGGGADGLPILDVFIKSIKMLSIPAVVITGPRMSIADREILRSSVSDLPIVRVLDYVKDLPSYLKCADVVVSMAGYNTLTEVVAHNCKSIVIPRTWYSGEHSGNGYRIDLEQLIRARSLDNLGLINLIEPKKLDPKVLADNIDKVIKNERKVPKININLSGVENSVNHILEMANIGAGNRY
jgi:predicted glycosyltransferase